MRSRYLTLGRVAIDGQSDMANKFPLRIVSPKEN